MNALTHPLTDIHQTATWVLATQAGDRDAFGRLFERYRPGILAIITRRLKNEHAAQELCQDVFVQALRKIDQLRTPECFGSWLRQIAVRMAINYQQRHRAAMPLDPSIVENSVVDPADPAGTALCRERASQVRGGLRRLRALDRETLEAFYVRGRSLIEMAGEFDAPVGTIKHRLHVARKRLAAALSDQLPDGTEREPVC